MVHADDASAKRALRLILRDARKALSAAAPDAGERAAKLYPADRLGRWPVVAGYWPSPTEIDPFPLMRRMAEAGARLALPVATAHEEPLTFRTYAPGDPLAPDVCGISAPLAALGDMWPDLVICPALGFDARGGRIGQGGGHYDRTLAALRAHGAVFVLGLAFAGQQVARVPTGPYDQRLDAILTEAAYIETAED